DLAGIENLAEEEAEPKLRMYAINKMVERIRATVARVNVRYDEWYYENRLWESGLPQEAIQRLRESGRLKERDGALWFGDPSDDVEASRPIRHARRAHRQGRLRCSSLLLSIALAGHDDRVRPRAGGHAGQREPGLLRPVRARAPGERRGHGKPAPSTSRREGGRLVAGSPL